MGKLKSHIQDFLENGGYDLGYSETFLPELSDLDYVLDNDVDAWTYEGSKRLQINIKEAYEESDNGGQGKG